VNRLAKGRREDQVRQAVRGAARGFWLCFRGEILQEFQHPLLQPDDAPAPISFRLGKAPASTHSFERTHDAHGASLPVDVLPLQGEVLARLAIDAVAHGFDRLVFWHAVHVSGVGGSG